MSKPRKPRKRPMNVAAVIEMAAFRNEMRAMAADRIAYQRRNSAWRRITAKLVVTAIVIGFGSLIVAHAMASHG